MFLRGLGMLPAGPAAAAAITAWSAGILLYLVISVLVAGRLLLVGVGPREATNPYWVAMGAASIAVVAAAGILRIPAGRPPWPGPRSPIWRSRCGPSPPC